MKTVQKRSRNNYKAIFKRTLFLAVLITFFSNCTPNFKITYKTKDISHKENQALSKITLDIETFVDKRKTENMNTILFVEGPSCKVDGKRVLINAEKHYVKPEVTVQIQQLLVNHMNAKKTFKKVIKNKKDSADYYVSGNLTKLYGIQDFSASSTIFAGVFATSSGETTHGKIIFEITDLKIFNKTHGLIKDLGTFTREYEGDFPNGGIWSCMYMNVNEKLKEYYSELISKVEIELEKTLSEPN